MFIECNCLERVFDFMRLADAFGFFEISGVISKDTLWAGDVFKSLDQFFLLFVDFFYIFDEHIQADAEADEKHAKYYYLEEK